MSKAIRNVVPANKLRPKKTQKYSIILPCAGEGSRMLTYGAKSLIKIKKQHALIDIQLKIINKIFNRSEIILVTGFESDRVMNRTPNYLIKVENENYKETNVVRSIGIGLRAATTDHVVIIYGDLYFNEDAILAPFRNESTAIIDIKGHMKDDEVGCIIQDGYIQHMCYDLPNKWAQILFLTGKELEIFKYIAWNKNKRKYYGFEAINEIIDRGGKIRVFSSRRAVMTDIDCRDDLKKVQKMK